MRINAAFSEIAYKYASREDWFRAISNFPGQLVILRAYPEIVAPAADTRGQYFVSTSGVSAAGFEDPCLSLIKFD